MSIIIEFFIIFGVIHIDPYKPDFITKYSTRMLVHCIISFVTDNIKDIIYFTQVFLI